MSQSPAPPPEDVPEGAFDVVVLAGSAGGAAAAARALRALMPDCALPIVLMLHLPPDSDLAEYFGRFPFAAGSTSWVTADSRLAAGQLLVCPPRAFVQLTPDGRCQLTPCERGALDRPIDRLLQSVARSFGPRAIAVLLTGMGNDGAAGARELHAAGGQVLVQSPATAEYADMPKAAIDAGAAHLVVPLDDLGQVVLELVAGTPRPKARSELQAIARAFGDRGEIAGLARQIDWSATVLGPALMWPEELKTLVRVALDAPQATAVWWGPQLAQLYNDAWRGYLDVSRHPAALGGPARLTWARRWPDIEPAVLAVLARGEAVRSPEELVFVERHDLVEETYLAFTYSPLRNAAGEVAGLLHTVRDQTSAVLAERRMRALQALATHAADAETPRDVCARAAAALAGFPADLPFALFYLLDSHERHAALAAAAGLVAGSPAAPHLVHLTASDLGGWPLLKEWFGGGTGDGPWWVDGLPARFPQLAAPAYAPEGSRVPERALVLPLRLMAVGRPAGALVLGLSPHQPYDAGYRGFLSFVAQQVNASLGDARARELERERLDRLAALDLARTDFFSNVSHEFRTPLTLLLAPLEALAGEREALPPRIGAELDVAVRNARRLLRLVNSLLDFSQIELRGRQALLAPVDLGALTQDIASAFRSAIESAGLALNVEMAAGLPPVPVNTAMWEQLVSNLLSNALKFTFAGAITVRLRGLRMHAELEVGDTGVGIPAHELPNIFKRFHRVHGSRARTAEGSGIGLAVVQDLAQRMGGQVSVRSVEGQGSMFTVWLPLKAQPARLAPVGDALAPQPSQLPVDLADEAARWSSGRPAGVAEDVLDLPAGAQEASPGPRPRLLVVDDNADLRDYLRRLLGGRWEVQAAADGEQALALCRAQPPDLVLADVMMPGLDGFALLQRLRETPRLAAVPVILLTARASEEAAIEGLRAGANDYIAKPFSPRELVARLQAALGRAQAEAALRESEAKFRAVFETMIEACCIFEMIYDGLGKPVDWRVLEANPAYETQSGLKDVAGRLASEFMPGTEAYWFETFGRIVETGEAEQIEQWHQPTGRWVHSSTARVGGAGSRRLVSVFYDITERKRAEIALRESEAHLARELADARVLQDISNQLVAAAAPDGHYNRIVEAARRLMLSDAASIQELDAADSRLKLLAHTGFHPESAAFWAYVDADVGSSCGRALIARDRVVVPDMDEFEADPHDVAAYRRSGIMAVQSTPLVASSGRIIGMMSTHWKHPHTPSADSYRFFDVLARLAADFIERARAKAALRDSELKYRTLFNAIDER